MGGTTDDELWTRESECTSGSATIHPAEAPSYLTVTADLSVKQKQIAQHRNQCISSYTIAACRHCSIVIKAASDINLIWCQRIVRNDHHMFLNCFYKNVK